MQERETCEQITDLKWMLEICGESTCNDVSNDDHGEEVNEKDGRSGGDDSWIVFGVSYLEAWSACFQIKFPNYFVMWSYFKLWSCPCSIQRLRQTGCKVSWTNLLICFSPSNP